MGSAAAGREEAAGQAREERRGEPRPRPDKDDGFLESGFTSFCSSELPFRDGAARVFWFPSVGV